MSEAKTLCDNPAHEESSGTPRAAAVRLEWPSGRFKPTTACRSDLRWAVSEALDNGWPLLITPL